MPCSSEATSRTPTTVGAASAATTITSTATPLPWSSLKALLQFSRSMIVPLSGRCLRHDPDLHSGFRPDTKGGVCTIALFCRSDQSHSILVGAASAATTITSTATPLPGSSLKALLQLSRSMIVPLSGRCLRHDPDLHSGFRPVTKGGAR